MPLFRASGERGGAKAPAGRRRVRKMKWKGSCGRTDEDGSIPSLMRLCLLSLADNMKEVWVKDYADNYLDQYSFRHIMGPFNFLPGELVEELTWLLCTRNQLTRAALHLLLVPQLHGLSLERCPGLVTSALCAHIAARCQGLWSLDLSGAQQLPSKVLSETLCCLPALRSLSLAGTPCDRRVIKTIAHHCRWLRHLDVSRCHFLSPAALLSLGGGALCSSSTSSPNSSGDPVAAAAYLLLALSGLERVAMEGLGQACCLIERREFSQMDAFTDREGVPRLEEVWRERRHRDEGPSCSLNQAEEKKRGRALSQSDDERLILRLKDAKGLSCDFLDTVGRLCPNISSISVTANDNEDTSGRSQGSLLAAGLQTWSGQLQNLSVHFPGPLVDLLPALQVAGSSLVSLTLEGVKTSPHSPLLEIIKSCPRLRDLVISAEPPDMPDGEDEVDMLDYRDLPQLPNLFSLTLNLFTYNDIQMPVRSWMSLQKVLQCLLMGSPLLEKVSLVSLPCRLDHVLQHVLRRGELYLCRPADSAEVPPMPLGRVQHLDLMRTDVTMMTLRKMMQRSKRLKFVDVSYCWAISQFEWLDCKTVSDVKIVWL
uniref:Si:ch211-214j8.12 n=1 Tax=Lates calcarifer TaxID=8187 RepID=A0A4W6G7Y0_LATCA